MGTVYSMWVHLAPTEYDGGYRGEDGTWVPYVWPRTGKHAGRMWDAAREVFDAYPEFPDMVVEVWEHGGWHLAWTREGLTVATANDTARFGSDVREWAERVRGFDRIDLGTWRKKEPEERYQRPTLKLAAVG